MKYLRYLLIVTIVFGACAEEQRFGLHMNDNTVPGAPSIRDVKPFYGGAWIYYNLPTDEDLLMVVAEYDAPNGSTFRFSASYFRDSLAIHGLGEEIEYNIRLFAVNRSGNNSEIVNQPVIPLESVIRRVARSVDVKPGFEAFYVDWHNELRQTVNLIVEYDFVMDGRHREILQVLSSNREFDRQFIRGLTLEENQPVNVTIRVEDIYGNITEPQVFEPLTLMQDIRIPKENWRLPVPGDSIAGIPMVFGNFTDGRMERVIDDIIDWRQNNNYLNTEERGRVGLAGVDSVNRWNLFIDLGDYYELSRILTHQRHSGGTLGQDRGFYYGDENVGHYKLWYLDETLGDASEGHTVLGEWVTGRWIPIVEHYIPIPEGLSDVDFIRHGQRGDECYMYPDDPGFTPPVRWFRYESIAGFADNYSNTRRNKCISEVTLFGRGPVPKP